MKGTSPVVIVGGGFAGVRAALDLDKLFGHRIDAPIFLIDPSPYHIYTPTLYTVASAAQPRAQLIAYKDIFSGTNVHHIQERVTHIDLELKHVITESRRYHYHDLILALGSQSRELNDASEHDYQMLACKTLDDLLAIRQRIDHCFRVVRNFKSKECHNHFVIVGAGPTGVEFASGLHEFIKQESHVHNLPHTGVHITLVETGNKILPGLSREVAKKTSQFLKKQGIAIRLNTPMSWKGHQRLMLDDTELPLQTVIWTAGVAPHKLVRTLKGLRHDDSGRVLVDAGLQAIGAPGVWVAGDSVAVKDSGMAQSAVEHGKHVARAIMATRESKKVEAYHPKSWPFILQLNQDYGLGSVQGSLLEGKIAVLYKYWQDVRYLFSVLSPLRAFQYYSRGGTALNTEHLLCRDCQLKDNA